MNHTASAPTNWRELVIARETALIGRLAAIDRVPSIMAGLLPPFHPGDAIGGAVRTLAEALLLFGPERCREALNLLAGLLDNASRDMDPRRPGRVPTTIGLLSFFVVAENAGVLPSGSKQHQAEDWIITMAHREPALEPSDSLACAILAAALDHDGPARELLGSVTRSDVFDLPGLLALLQDGIARGVSADVLRSDWEHFLDSFPLLLSNGGATWTTIHAVARVYLNRLGGIPVDQVAAVTHREVMQAITRSR